MAFFARHPCCICRLRSQKPSLDTLWESLGKTYNLEFKRIIEQVLQQLLYYINPKMTDHWCDHDGDDYYGEYDDLTEREYNMQCSMIALLKDRYDKYPNKIQRLSVKTHTDVISVLESNLEYILEDHLELAENPFAILTGRSTYQALVLNCLLFGAKFMSQCMKTLKTDPWQIFNDVVKKIDDFFGEKYILEWILHDLQSTEPFGKLPNPPATAAADDRPPNSYTAESSDSFSPEEEEEEEEEDEDEEEEEEQEEFVRGSPGTTLGRGDLPSPSSGVRHPSEAAAAAAAVPRREERRARPKKREESDGEETEDGDAPPSSFQPRKKRPRGPS